MKGKVYFEPVGSPEDVVARIHAAVTFRDENMLQKVCDSTINRVNVCIEVGGDMFEGLL